MRAPVYGATYTAMAKSTASAQGPAPQPAQPDYSCLECQSVRLFKQNQYLMTEGLAVGDRVAMGPYTAALVTAIYAVELGYIVELNYGGREVAILHKGEGSAVLV